jgi:hypothetical protein
MIFFNEMGNSYGVGVPDVHLPPPVKTEGYVQVVPLGQVSLMKTME